MKWDRPTSVYPVSVAVRDPERVAANFADSSSPDDPLVEAYVEQGCVTVTVDHYSPRDAQRWATLRAGNVVPDGEPFVVFLRPMLDTLGPAALEAVGA